MPTNRTRKSRKARDKEIDPAVLARLTGAPCPKNANVFVYGYPADPAGDWELWKATILAEWAVSNPGTRPSAWWQYDAPEQRRRLGGKGTPCHEVMAHSPLCRLGIPLAWVEDYFIDNMGIVAERLDSNDPLRYESQAAFLKRHKLLAKSEATRLTKKDFEPEMLSLELWPA